MWTMSQNDDDSWEVRAFEEDTTGNILGCTWPPRSYTCSFCRREFRSAQALGGHMNVHRRDRARLLQTPAVAHPPILGNGLCLLYPLPNPNSILFSNPPPPDLDCSSPLPPTPHSVADKPLPNSVVCHSPSPSNNQGLAEEEELDLELRLGRRQSHPTP